MKRPVFIAFGFACFMALTGCAYKGGKVVDGTNLAIGLRVPGTDWSLAVLDYVGGVRVAGQDATRITVSHSVAETNDYFGVVTTRRASTLRAEIEPMAGQAATNAPAAKRGEL